MDVIELRLKKKYFEAVLQGRKVQEFREIRPNNESRFIELDSEGYAVCDDAGNAKPIPYDAVKFICDDSWVLVKIRESYTEMLVDDAGEPIWYDYYGERYYAERIVYNLGEIISYECH